jgi:hypothetical protein
MTREQERREAQARFDAAIERMANLAEHYRAAWEELLAENDRLRAQLTGKVNP